MHFSKFDKIEVKAVKVAGLATMHGVLAALRGVLAAKDTHGGVVLYKKNFYGLELLKNLDKEKRCDNLNPLTPPPKKWKKSFL